MSVDASTRQGICPCGLVCACVSAPHRYIDWQRQVSACRLWIRTHAHSTKTIRKRWSSYSLKSKVESWSQTVRGGVDYIYIPNGAFIVAAQLEGFRIEQCSARSPNAWFNMTFPSLRRRYALL